MHCLNWKRDDGTKIIYSSRGRKSNIELSHLLVYRPYLIFKYKSEPHHVDWICTISKAGSFV